MESYRGRPLILRLLFSTRPYTIAALVDAIVDALKKGKRELTYPRAIAAGYVVRAIAPQFMRANVKRSTKSG